MPAPRKEDVYSVLEPYHAKIRNVVTDAWDEWRKVVQLRADNDLPPVLYSRTVSNDVFDAIARFGIAAFNEEPGVNLKIEKQTFKLFFRGRVCARYKRGDDNNLGQNIPTQMALALQDPEAELPELPPHTFKVEIIWLANELNTRLELVLIVARDGDRQLWKYEIDDVAGSSGELLPFAPPPTPPAPETGDEDEQLITPKHGQPKRAEESGDK